MRHTFSIAGAAAVGLAGCGLFLPLDELPPALDGGIGDATPLDGPGADGAMDAVPPADGAGESGRDADTGDARADREAGGDGGGPCRWDTPFVGYSEIAALEVTQNEGLPRLSPDELTAYFYGLNVSSQDLWVASRTNAAQPFSTPAPVSVVDTMAAETDPSISPDGLALYYTTDANTGDGFDIDVATRTSPSGTFSLGQSVAAVNTAAFEFNPYVAPATGDLYFARGSAPKAYDLYRAQASAGGLRTPASVGAVNTASLESSPVVGSDELTLYFASDRGANGVSIYVSHRASTAASFDVAQAVPVLPTGGVSDGTRPGWLSVDYCRLYFSSDSAGSSKIYVAARAP